jgi:Trk K+ transport system NAD-binding subunit
VISALSRDESSDLRLKLNALGYGFFIPIFFIMVGAEFDLEALAAEPRALVLIPAMVGAAFAVKYVAALVYRPLFGWGDVFALGTLTSARLSLIIAVSAIGLQMGLIPPATNSAIILLAIITVFAAPLLFNRAVPEVKAQLGPVFVVGASPHARLLARRLQDHGERVRILTANAANFEEARALGLEPVRLSRRGDLEELRDCGIEEARAVVCMMDDETETFRVATASRNIFGVETVAAYIQDPQLGRELGSRGVQVVDPGFSLSVVLEAAVRHPRIFSLLTDIEDDRIVKDVLLTNRRLEGRLLRDAQLPRGALIFMVARDGEVFIPRGNTRFEGGDVLTVVGSAEAVEEAADRIGG